MPGSVWSDFLACLWDQLGVQNVPLGALRAPKGVQKRHTDLARTTLAWGRAKGLAKLLSSVCLCTPGWSQRHFGKALCAARHYHPHSNVVPGKAERLSCMPMEPFGSKRRARRSTLHRQARHLRGGLVPGNAKRLSKIPLGPAWGAKAYRRTKICETFSSMPLGRAGVAENAALMRLRPPEMPTLTE